MYRKSWHSTFSNCYRKDCRTFRNKRRRSFSNIAGVIGVPIQINDLVKNLPNLVSDLKGNSFENAAEAILTTDLT